MCRRRPPSARRALAVGCIVLPLWGLGADGSIVGVAPADEHRYASASSGLPFTCSDGGADIPASSVNDNYCDCSDGSDEPGTAACAGRAGAHFYCKNAMSVSRLIYASRVNDGICDCCDGSDEGGPARGPCPDTCRAEGALVQAEQHRRQSALADGLRVREATRQQALDGVAAWQAEAASLDRRLEELELARAGAVSLRDGLQAAALQAGNASSSKAAEEAAGSVLFTEDFEAEDAPGRWSQADGRAARIIEDPRGERGKVLAFSGCTWGGDTFSREGFACGLYSACKISFWARGAPWQGFSTGTKRTEEELADAHSWLAVPADNQEFPGRLAATRAADGWEHYEYDFPGEDAFQMFGSDDVRFSTSSVHIMVQSHASTGFCTETMFDDFRVVKENFVRFVDRDGDQVEFRLSDAGTVGVLANGESITARLRSVRSEGGTLYFQDGEGDDGESLRTSVPSEDISRRVLALFARRAGAEKGAAAAAAAPAEAPAGTPGTPEVSEYAKWALDREAAAPEASAAGAAPEAAASGESAPAAVGAAAPAAGSGDEDMTWVRREHASVGSDPLSEAERELQNATDAVKRVEKEIADAKTQRRATEAKVRNAGDDFQWFPLIGLCVERPVAEFTYKICFFADAHQGATRLGSFAGWDAASGRPVMLFSNGQHCHGGPARTLRVQLVCGPSAEILDVSEPSRCTYEAEVLHPSACRQEDLDLLREQQEKGVVLMPRDEL